MRLVAAYPAEDFLSVVTLSWTGQHLRLVTSGAAFFVLQSEDQAGVRAFADDILRFANCRRLSQVLVQRGPTTGPRQISPASLKMETVLQLMPFTCVNVHVQRVSNWAKARDWLLPLPQAGLTAKRREKQETAIQLAAYGIACVLSNSREPADAPSTESAG